MFGTNVVIQVQRLSVIIAVLNKIKSRIVWERRSKSRTFCFV